MTLKKTVVVVTLMSLSQGVFAGGRGTAAAGFLKQPAGARAAGMGEAYAALADEASALTWNPAALSQVQGRSVTLMHAAGLESTAFNYGAYAQSLGQKNALGAAVQHQTAGSLVRRDVFGSQEGSFTPTDTAFSLGAARSFGALSLGLSGKWIQSKVLDSAQTFAGDAGALWRGKSLSLAVAVNNLGGKITYDKTAEKLPSIVRAGVAWRGFDRWRMGLEAVKPSDNDVYAAAGLEADALKTARFSLRTRAGYNTRSSGDVGGLSGATFGLGFSLKGLTVDYAFLPMGDLGADQKLSLSHQF